MVVLNGVSNFDYLSGFFLMLIHILLEARLQPLDLRLNPAATSQKKHMNRIGLLQC
jgi:hypothetical protein